jgi:hypothetical protein
MGLMNDQDKAKLLAMVDVINRTGNRLTISGVEAVLRGEQPRPEHKGYVAKLHLARYFDQDSSSITRRFERAGIYFAEPETDPVETVNGVRKDGVPVAKSPRGRKPLNYVRQYVEPPPVVPTTPIVIPAATPAAAPQSATSSMALDLAREFIRSKGLAEEFSDFLLSRLSGQAVAR